MKRKSNLPNVILSALIGLTLILSAVNPTAAYASGMDIVRPTQTPTSTPTVPPLEIPSATPVPSETPIPIFETPLPTTTESPIITATDAPIVVAEKLGVLGQAEVATPLVLTILQLNLARIGLKLA